MTQATKNIIGLIIGAVLLFIIGFAFVHAARSEPAPLDPTKFYLTVTVSDETGRVYTKLAYRTSGPWDTKEACEQWVPDDAFKAQLPILLAKVAEAFGPAADVKFACEQPPAPKPPGDRV